MSRSAWRSAAAIAAASVCCWSWASSAAARSSCGGFGGGALGGLLVELFLEAVDLGADPGRVVSGGRARLFEFTLEPVGTLAVFRRLGGGDVDERLEVGGGSGGGVGVLLELGFECGGALARLAGCGVRRVAFRLEFRSARSRYCVPLQR